MDADALLWLLIQQQLTIPPCATARFNEPGRTNLVAWRKFLPTRFQQFVVQRYGEEAPQ